MPVPIVATLCGLILIVVIESGMGFAFLALVIGYLPDLNQSFARREVSISLLDARAGSPPTASEKLRRHSHEGGMEALQQLPACRKTPRDAFGSLSNGKGDV